MNKLLLYMAMLLLPCAVMAQSKKSDGYFAAGVELYRSGQYGQAIPYFEKAWQLDQREIAPESNRYAYSLSWLASCYYRMGNKAKARELSAFDCDMEPVDRRLTVEADREGDLSDRAYMDGDIDGAIQHALRSLELERAVLQEPSFCMAASYLTLGDRYNDKSDGANAAKYYTKAIETVGALGCESDVFEYQARMGRCYAYLALTNLPGAKNDAERALAIAEKVRNESGEEYPLAIVKAMLARILVQDRDIPGALTHVKEAVRVMTERYPASPDDAFMHLVDCLDVLGLMGRFDESESIIKGLVPVVEAHGANRSHLGMLYSYLGDVSASREEVLQNYRKALEYLDAPAMAKEYYATLTALARVTDRPETIKLLNSVVNHYDETGDGAGNCQSALMSLGDLYTSEGRDSEAIDCYMRALNMPGLDKNSPEYCLTVLKAAPVYITYGYNSAGELQPVFRGFDFAGELNRALQTVLNNYSNRSEADFFAGHSISPATVVRSLLPLYKLLLSKATINAVISWAEMERQLTLLLDNYLTPFYSDSDDIIWDTKQSLAHVKYLQGDYPGGIALMKEVIASAKAAGREYDNYLHDLAYYQYDSGDTDGAYENFEVGYNFNKKRILTNYRWMTLEERDAYTAANRGNIDNIPHYAALTPDDRRYAALGYNALLFSKGLLLNSTIELSRLLQEAGDRETLSLLDRWRSVNRQYQRLQAEGKTDIGKLKSESERLERRLLERSTVYGDYTKGLTVEYQQVQQALGENDVAVEFFWYQLDARSRMYGALLLTRHDSPRYVPVGSDRNWQTIIDSCYRSPEFFNAVFAGLRPALPAKAEGSIYFAAAGQLHAVAIENICGAEDYDFRRLSSTRELALTDKTAATARRMAVYGGIRYGVGSLAEFYVSATDGKRESGTFLTHLPETKIEADDIHSLLADRLKVDRLTEEKATEASFKNLSGRHVDLLHVATHGFFEPPAGRLDSGQYSGKAMASSGLYFAGAQNTLWNEDTSGMKEDGILTADEISLLDLRGLRLAVLSACETGKGVDSPDGVFGLQRGFKQAGTGSLMMSLWKVDDKATRLLMGEFYRRLLSGENQYQALAGARQTVRHSYPDPRFWAAFVLVDALNEIKI